MLAYSSSLINTVLVSDLTPDPTYCCLCLGPPSLTPSYRMKICSHFFPCFSVSFSSSLLVPRLQKLMTIAGVCTVVLQTGLESEIERKAHLGLKSPRSMYTGTSLRNSLRMKIRNSYAWFSKLFLGLEAWPSG